MKRKVFTIVFILIGVFATSCSLFTSRYSEEEYTSFIRILTWAEHAQKNCKNDVRVPNYLTAIHEEALFLTNFGRYRENDVEVVTIADMIGDNARQSKGRYALKGHEGVSESYCKAKLEILIIAANKGARMVAGKPIE